MYRNMLHIKDKAMAIFQRGSISKCVEIVLAFLYLEILLWFALSNHTTAVDKRIVPKDYLFANQITTIIRVETPQWILFKSLFFSTMAMFGYVYGIGCTFHVDDRNVREFESAVMGMKKKFYWMSLFPYIAIFTQAWLNNAGHLFGIFTTNATKSYNIASSAMGLLFVLLTELLMASEIVALAVNGYCAMIKIDEQNFQWEQHRGEFGDDVVETAFGTDPLAIE